MIPNDLRTQLGAFRSDRSADDQSELADALKAAGGDPSLAEWLASETAFDDSFRSAIKQLAPPAGLRQSILSAISQNTDEAGDKPASGTLIAPSPSVWWRHPAVLSAAASVAILFMVGVIMFKPQNLQASSELPDFYRHVADHSLTTKNYDLETQELDSIHDYLLKQNVPTPDRYPRGAADLVPYGCHTLDWRGRTITGICLRSTTTDKVVHLYVAHRADFPNENHPTETQLQQTGDNLSMAVWACSNRIYVLIVRGSMDDLNQLL